VSNGRRWLALDADMMSKRFAHDLYERFGWAGIGVWVAFLCACKQSRTPGRVRMASDLDGMTQLEIYGWDLVDAKGEPFTLTEFFDFTGRKKQTRRVAVQRPDSRRIEDARLLDVGATHWERWQDAYRTDAERERKRRWVTENRVAQASRDPSRDRRVPRREVDADIDIDIDSDIPQTPPGAEPPDPLTNSRSNSTNPRARGTNPRATHQEAERTPIPDWTPEPEPADPVNVANALEALRTERGWTKPE
jgi:hypothetical protein